MPDALIVDAVRSPIGKRNGTLSKIRGDELAAQVLNALVARSDVDPAEIEDVQMGCVTQIGEQGWNIGRMTPLVAGIIWLGVYPQPILRRTELAAELLGRHPRPGAPTPPATPAPPPPPRTRELPCCTPALDLPFGTGAARPAAR